MPKTKNSSYINRFKNTLLAKTQNNKNVTIDEINDIFWCDENQNNELYDELMKELEESGFIISDGEDNSDESDDSSEKTISYSSGKVDDLLKSYSNYVKQIPKLEREEERDLIYKAQNGDKEAVNKLVQANLSLVLGQVRQMIGSSSKRDYSNIMDQIQEGNMGLMKAIDKFDLSKENRFSTYAVYWIRQQVKQSNLFQKLIKIPSHIMDSTVKVIRTANTLEQELSREASPEEIADILNLPVEKVREIILRGMSSPIPLSTPLNENNEGTIIDVIKDQEAINPETEVLKKALSAQIMQALETLDERESEILKMRFGFKGKIYTLEEVGQIFDITRERVRQIEAKALRRLRHPSRSGYLADFKY